MRTTKTIRDNETWQLNVTPTMKGHNVYSIEKKNSDICDGKNKYILIRIFYNPTVASIAWQGAIAT